MVLLIANVLMLSSSILVSLLDQSSVAAEPTDASSAELKDPTSCPSLFGDDEVQEDNAAFRQRRLFDVRATGGRTMVVHGVASWLPPSSMRLKGITLHDVEVVDVEHDDGRLTEERVAVVEVQDQNDDGCETGLYAVAQDASLGRLGQVLSVDDKGVLVEFNGKLGWLFWDGHVAPRTSMVWRSGYDIIIEEPTKKSTAKKAKAKKKSRRKR